MVDVMQRRGEFRDVPIEKLRSREGVSQRKYRPDWAARIAENFEIEDFGFPVVNHVGEWFWILDGQHRIAALKTWLEGGWAGQMIKCFVYRNLTEKEEARLFDRLNTTKAVSTFDKFIVRQHAGEVEETNVDAIVRKNGLKISRDAGANSIGCVGTLLKVLRRSEDALDRTLGVAFGAFGESGLDADVIDGLGTLVGRYDGQIEDKRLISVLKDLRGGVSTLRQRGERVKQQYGGSRSQAIAAAAVEIYNSGRGGKKLAGWWKSESE